MNGDNERNKVNENENGNENDNGNEQLFDDPDPNAWVATGEMGSLPTTIFKRNTLSQSNRKTILQSEPRNKDISFEPPVMDRKVWTTMPRYAKENDKNVR